jgi:site-specific DNA-adenine methylase
MRYPGGKGRCYHHIISLMPKHRVFIETHLGGGAILRHKRPATVNIGVDIDPDVISTWKKVDRRDLNLVQADACDFLRSYDFQGDEIVYCYPPYLQETRRRQRIYRFEYSRQQHIELLNILLSLPCNVIVSGYRSQLYDATLSGWRSLEFPGDSHTGPRTEVVWMNFDPPALLHDHSYLGGDFRARETIKRRRRGLMSRVASLSAEERQALFVELAAAHETEMEQALRTGPR